MNISVQRNSDKNHSGKNHSALVIIAILALGMLLAGCSFSNPGSVPTATDSGTQPATQSGEFPSPGQTIIPVPDPSEAARAYLSAWDTGDYESMYNQLTTLSRDAIPYEQFSAR